jgi:predicted ester cyclase
MDVAAAGGRVAMRAVFRGTHRGEFLGVPPANRSVAMRAMAFIRVADGRLAETWICRDRASLVQQLRG